MYKFHISQMQYQLKTLLMWLWQVRILMTMMTILPMMTIMTMVMKKMVKMKKN